MSDAYPPFQKLLDLQAAALAENPSMGPALKALIAELVELTGHAVYEVSELDHRVANLE